MTVQLDTYIQQQLNTITDTSDFMQFYKKNVALFRQYTTANYLKLAQRLKNGTGIIQSYSDTLNYMVLYGGFLYQCFDATTQHIFQEYEMNICSSKPICLVDYACGQGSASLVMMDRIMQNHPDIQSLHITLIEPSSFSIQRAKQLVLAKAQHYGIKVSVNCYNCTFDQLSAQFLNHAENQQIFHLFANILDLYDFGGFDLHQLVHKIKTVSAQHTLIAMSTKHPKSFESDDTLGFHMIHQLINPDHPLLGTQLNIKNVQYYKHSYNYRCMVTENKNMLVYACQWS